MKSKKLLCVLLGVVLVVSMLATGCKKEKEVKKIVVFQSKVEIIDQLEAAAKDFKKETGIEVEVWGTTGDDYLQQLRLKLSNNQGPTV
ncbi:MAG: ABC transporter substrate-binding protein, partial [Bacteroidales bacterium]|nr:ABC transporter substrate-binding protein [Bacteroidales bacterium]